MEFPKAIETNYRGCRFRSRLEARWVVFFDALWIEWQYEMEGFNLPAGRYLPDFWMPQVKMWAEVKPVAFTSRELTLCVQLMHTTGYPVLLLDGPPAARDYLALTESRFHKGDWVVRAEVFSLVDGNRYHLSENRFYHLGYFVDDSSFDGETIVANLNDEQDGEAPGFSRTLNFSSTTEWDLDSESRMALDRATSARFGT